MEQHNGKAKDFFNGKEIFLIPYGHADYSWIHTRNWHIDRYVTMLEEAAELLDSEPAFCYYIDNYSALLEPVLRRRPRLAEKLRPHLESGRFEICGTYANIRPDMVDGEAFIRNMVIGRRRFAEVFPAADIRVYADTVDVVAGHSQIPQLLQKGGYRYIRIGRPADILRQKGIPLDHVWIGADGSRLLCSYASTSGFWNREETGRVFSEDAEASVSALYETEFAADAGCFDSRFLMKGMGCDDGVPLRTYHPGDRLPVFRQMELWNRAGVSIRFGVPRMYFDALEQDRGSLQTVNGPQDICGVSYNVCLGGEKSLVSRRLLSAESIASAETAAAFAALLAGESPRDLTALWEENLFCSSHASQWAYREDYADLCGRMDYIQSASGRIRGQSCQSLTAAIDTAENCRAVVFNPHDRPRRVPVYLELSAPDPAGLRLCDGFGNPLEVQALHPYYFSFMGELVWEWRCVVMADVPSLGYNSVMVEQGSTDTLSFGCWPGLPQPRALSPERDSIQTDELLLEFEHGRLSQITHLASGASAAGWFYRLRFHRYAKDPQGLDFPNYPVEEVCDAVWDSCELLGSGPVAWVLRLKGRVHSHSVEQTVTVYQGSPCVHLDTKVEYRKAYGILTLGVPCAGTESLYGGIPFGTEARDVSAEPYLDFESVKGWDEVGCQHRIIPGLFYAADFAGMQAGGLSVGLCAKSGDRYFLHDAGAGDVSHILNVTAERLPLWAQDVNDTAFSSFGIHDFSHALVVGPAGMPRHDMQQRAQALRRPPEIVLPVRTAPPGTLSPAGSLLETDRENVRVSAFYREGDFYLLRLWEAAGEQADCRVTLPLAPKEAVRIDFQGSPEDGSPPQLREREMEVALRPCEIVTLRILF